MREQADLQRKRSVTAKGEAHRWETRCLGTVRSKDKDLLEDKE